MTAISDRVYAEEQIIAIGGREWCRSGIRRIYLNGCAEWGGLEIATYRHGGIKAAWLNDERISNARAAEIRYVLDRIWWSPEDGRIHADLRRVRETRELHQALDRLADEIARRVDALSDAPADEPADAPVDEPADAPADEPADAPADEPADAPADAPADEPADDEQSSTDPVHRVAELRQAGRSVREIAAMIGCAVSTVYRWLRGVHRPSARYATAILAIA